MSNKKTNPRVRVLRDVDQTLPEYALLTVCIDLCILDLLRSLGPEGTLFFLLFEKKGIYRSECLEAFIGRWGINAPDLEDLEGNPVRIEDYPDIGDSDFLVSCNPEYYHNPKHFWQTYKEEVFRRILEDVFTWKVKEHPELRQEYEQALAKYGMRLQLPEPPHQSFWEKLWKR